MRAMSDPSSPNAAEAFTQGVTRSAYQATVADALVILANPPGRNPDSRLIKASTWYRSLSEADRDALEIVMRLVAHDAIFGVLAAIDGSRDIGIGENVTLHIGPVPIQGDLHSLFRSSVTDSP